MTDVHVHLAALPTPKNGCLLSPKMRKSALTKLLAWRQGLPLDDAETANRRYREKLIAELAASRVVKRAVLLAMDGVYDREGRLDEAHTDFLISNDALFAACEGEARFLPGVSINPARRDALDELDRCADLGAVLVKVLPNAQAFDPSEPRYKAFYRGMAERGVALLSHVGYEFSLIGQDQSVGDPEHLVTALEQGVLVIAAHGGSTGLFLIEKHMDTIVALAKRFPNFRLDTSALTLPNRAGMLMRLRWHPELFERFVFGTDYPLACFSFPCLLAGKFGAFLEARRMDNRFDRQARVLEALGDPLGRDFAELVRKA